MEIKRKNRTHIEVVVLGAISLYYILNRMLNASENPEGISWPFVIVQALLFLFMGGLFIRSGLQLAKRSPALVIDSDGIVDNISLAKAGKIDSGNIAGFSIGKVTGSNHLIIRLKEHKTILSNLGSFRRRMLETVIEKHGTPVAINLKLLKIDPDKLMEVLESHFPKSASTETK